MKALQRYINKRLKELREKRTSLFFRVLPEEIRAKYFESLRLLDEVEDYLIINYIINKSRN